MVEKPIIELKDVSKKPPEGGPNEHVNITNTTKKELTKAQAEIFDGYKEVMDSILKDVEENFPKISTTYFKLALDELFNETIRGNQRKLSDKDVFRSRCDQIRRDLASKYYREDREKWQRMPTAEFLVKRKLLGMDAILREMGIRKGGDEFIENSNFLNEKFTNFYEESEKNEQTYKEMFWGAAKTACQKHELKGKEDVIFHAAVKAYFHETHGDPFAVSGGYAIMSLTSYFYDNVKYYDVDPINPFYPPDAIAKISDELARLLNEGDGDVDRMYTAYNGGLDAVERALAKAKKYGGSYKKYLKQEPRDYVAKLRRDEQRIIWREDKKSARDEVLIASKDVAIEPIKLSEPVIMVGAKFNDRKIPDFKIPEGREIIPTGKRNGDLAQAKFHSNYFKDYVTGWIPARVLSA